jgi:hypothetical protein
MSYLQVVKQVMNLEMVTGNVSTQMHTLSPSSVIGDLLLEHTWLTNL